MTRRSTVGTPSVCAAPVPRAARLMPPSANTPLATAPSRRNCRRSIETPPRVVGRLPHVRIEYHRCDSIQPMSLPLAPYTVIDLTRARSGPTCVRQLAEMGANVIKVESREQDDFTRDEFDFQNLHRNKRSITLDLKQPKGVEVLKKLAAKADVVVENFRADVKHRLHIDYETLSAINPRIVYASISGFGQTGRDRHRPGFDQIAQGMSGVMNVNGEPGQGPLLVGLPVADLTAGFMAAYGVVCALFERERSGRGQWIHT